MNEDIKRVSSANDYLLAKAQGAFLGAAIGDALGWPNEFRGNRVNGGGSKREIETQTFVKWIRRCGARFYPHMETILPGEYSDDTQLLLCTARSLCYGKDWWNFFTRRELPSWSLYERGGGGATKRAVASWINNNEPWAGPQKNAIRKYFQAGGNGVAMRIMPHCLTGVSDNSFEKLAINIVANGICTHGHPRALIGALAYGFAIWEAFRLRGTLEYGDIIERVLESSSSWSSLPNPDSRTAWSRYALQFSGYDYEKIWRETTNELLSYLEICGKAMRKGALSVDEEVLRGIGSFDRKINGSGTIAAAASIFLTSRYAVDPLNGVFHAAFAHGTDTDTIASMTGALLGAIAGTECFGTFSEEIQDAGYIRVLSEKLAQVQPSEGGPVENELRVPKVRLDTVVEKLQNAKPGEKISLPDGRGAIIIEINALQSLSETLNAKLFRLETSDGQLLYIKKMSRMRKEESTGPGPSPSQRTIYDAAPKMRPCEGSRIGMRIFVRDIAKARFFYEKGLGLKVTKETKTFISLSGVVALTLSRNSYDPNYKLPSEHDSLSIYIETAHIEAVYDNVRDLRAKIVTPLTQSNNRRYFKCYDPDGNEIDVYEFIRPKINSDITEDYCI